MYDEHDNGYITMDDLKVTRKELGILEAQIDDEALLRMIKVANTKDNGRDHVDLEDFMEVMKKAGLFGAKNVD
jgi:Ca2+-binding EF-hand superfamily protein